MLQSNRVHLLHCGYLLVCTLLLICAISLSHWWHHRSELITDTFVGKKESKTPGIVILNNQQPDLITPNGTVRGYTFGSGIVVGGVRISVQNKQPTACDYPQVGYSRTTCYKFQRDSADKMVLQNGLELLWDPHHKGYSVYLSAGLPRYSNGVDFELTVWCVAGITSLS